MSEMTERTSPQAMERLSAAAQRLGVPLQGEDRNFQRVVTDSRAVVPGDLFVALVGERHDGHRHIDEAMARGAVGALVSHAVDPHLPQILVSDTLQGLQQYARAWAEDLEVPVVGVTGSNGKTTTKQLMAAMFEARGPVLATQGNLNNHIGVPLTLCRLRRMHATAVIEMGANHPGEIALLAQLAQPTVGVVTQAGDAHLEGFGSREGVARAKGEMFSAVARTGGTAVINADDPYAPLWRDLAAGATILRFGTSSLADVRATAIEPHDHGSRFQLTTPEGSASVDLPLPGRHNVLNALAAAAAGHALGLPAITIAAGLGLVRPPEGRLSLKHALNGATVIDDSYNANPTSMVAGLELLAARGGRRIAVLGSMGELGPGAPALHRLVGNQARALGLDGLFVTGPMATEYAAGWGKGAQVFPDMEALLAHLTMVTDQSTSVLVKGSRSARMELIVAGLCGSKAGDAH